GRANRHVRIAAEAAFLHVAVVDAERDEQLAEIREERRGVLPRTEVRLGDDLDERRPGAIEVHVAAAAGVGESFVHELPRVLFHVDAGDTDVVRRGPVVALRLDDAAGGERPLVLRDLIALRQIRIEVVLAREDRRLVDVAAEGERRADRAVDGRVIEHRQCPGQAEAHRTQVRVGSGAERRAAAAEDLRLRQQLRVDLEADDGLVPAHALGPAAFTSGVTSASNALKLSANIFASFAACASYSAGLVHVVRGFRTSDGTPGHAAGTSRLNSRSFSYAT